MEKEQMFLLMAIFPLFFHLLTKKIAVVGNLH